MEAGVVGLAYRFLAERFAERGYHVIAQGTRGRFNSDGDFNPFFNEAADGQATLDWITRQSWCNGHLGMWGVSYMGYTQWAAATHPRVTPQLTALMPILTTSQFRSSPLVLARCRPALDANYFHQRLQTSTHHGAAARR